MKSIAPLSIVVCAIAASTFAGILKAQESTPALTILSMKDGETMTIRLVTLVTATCDPLFLSFDGLDVFEGPPELSLTFEPGEVRTFATNRDCPKLVPGGKVMATVKDIAAPKDSVLTFRVRFMTKQGPWQTTARYRMLLYPAAHAAEAKR